MPKLKNSLSVKLAIDSVLRIPELVFLALALASKKISKTVSETRAKWSQFGTVSETRGLTAKRIGTTILAITRSAWPLAADKVLTVYLGKRVSGYST